MRVLGARSRGERGAVAVEMAIVVPVLVLLVFGALELGLAFDEKLQMANAVNQATRNASVLGVDDYADIQALDSLSAGLNGNVGNIVEVHIFKADADGDRGISDRYVPDASSCEWDPCPDPDEGTPTYGSPSDYKPCLRDIGIGGGLDTVGVEVIYTHSWITGVLGIGTQTWHETARARLEPDLFGTAPVGCP